MAVFTAAKGGFMHAATISGQPFTYTPRGGNQIGLRGKGSSVPRALGATHLNRKASLLCRNA
jgi:hypothetical protein